MKVFAVILVALCAISIVHGKSVKQPVHQSGYDADSEQQEDSDMPWRENERQKPIGRQETTYNSRASLNSMQMQPNDPLETEWVDVVPFRTKIAQRLDTSLPLGAQPKIREKLMKFLEDKVEVCKLPGYPGVAKNQVNRACMGRLTGQMMQMIAAFEHGALDMPDSYDW